MRIARNCWAYVGMSAKYDGGLNTRKRQLQCWIAQCTRTKQRIQGQIHIFGGSLASPALSPKYPSAVGEGGDYMKGMNVSNETFKRMKSFLQKFDRLFISATSSRYPTTAVEKTSLQTAHLRCYRIFWSKNLHSPKPGKSTLSAY